MNWRLIREHIVRVLLVCALFWASACSIAPQPEFNSGSGFPTSDLPTREALRLLLGKSNTLANHKIGRRIEAPENEYYPRIEISPEPEVTYFVRYLIKDRRNFMLQALERKRRFLPLIEGVLREAGLPLELANLALIESGYNTSAVSATGAVGMWQFIRSTAIAYGLKIGILRDDRRDVVKSTAAAAKYLTDLHDQFGNWYLALAAYNAGPGALSKAIKQAGSRDFFYLSRNGYLRKETSEFVPKFLAAVRIGNNPTMYGFI